MGRGERPRGPREVRGGGAGEAKSEVCSGESGESDAASDAGMEEGEYEQAPLTASPWGRQESWERGLQEDVRAGGSDGGKFTSTTADRGGDTGPPWGAERTREGEREAGRVGKVQTPGEWR